MVAFVVEDGTGLANATSYAAVAFSDDYLGVDWADSSAEKEAFLIAGTEYLDLRWRPVGFKDRPLVSSQALEFPRRALRNNYGTLIEGVPIDILKATCLYAVQAKNGSLYAPLPSAGVPVQEIKKEKVIVGPITTETEYKGDTLVTNVAGFLPFPKADSLVKPYTISGGVSSGGRAIR